MNADLLALYFSVGGYIFNESRSIQWGSGAIQCISEQLQKELPGLRGFGASSIKNMRQFYEQWSKFIIRQPMAGKLQESKESLGIIRQPTAGELQTSTELPIAPLNFASSIFDVQTAHDFL